MSSIADRPAPINPLRSRDPRARPKPRPRPAPSPRPSDSWPPWTDNDRWTTTRPAARRLRGVRNLVLRSPGRLAGAEFTPTREQEAEYRAQLGRDRLDREVHRGLEAEILDRLDRLIDESARPPSAKISSTRSPLPPGRRADRARPLNRSLANPPRAANAPTFEDERCNTLRCGVLRARRLPDAPGGHRRGDGPALLRGQADPDGRRDRGPGRPGGPGPGVPRDPPGHRRRGHPGPGQLHG